MKNKYFFILALALFLCKTSTGQEPAQIKTIIEPPGRIDFAYTVSPLAAPFRFINPFLASFFDFYNLPTWGATNQYNNVMELTSSPLGDFAITQAYQKHDGDTISVVAAGNGLFPAHYIVGTLRTDGTVDTIQNLYEWINPDNHGIAIRNGVVYYCQSTFDTIFINDGINDGAYSAIGGDIRKLDLSVPVPTVIFNWFERVPSHFYAAEYWGEMLTGAGLDWPHFNWISFDHDGHLLVSYRTMGFLKINIDTGDVIWWGGLPSGLATANGFAELNCVSGDCRTRLNHSIKAFPGRPGWYTIFDNGDLTRRSSRGLVFSLDGLDMTVEEEYVTEPSPFMGSVDIYSENTRYVLVNTPTIGEDRWLDSLGSWIADSSMLENIEARLLQSGSVIRLIDRETGEVIGKWMTDSLNFVYAAEIHNLDIVTAVSDELITNDFEVFPNPADTFLMLPPGDYKLYNMSAQLMMRVTGERIDISALPPGQYIIVEKEAGQASFIKQ